MNSAKNHKFKQKKCTQCAIELDENNSNEYDTNYGKYICLSCLKIRNQTLYQNKKDYILARSKKYELSNKLKIIEAYGGKCSCCGENNYEFLTIDHINDNGAEERKITKQGTGGKIYRWLIKNNFPKDNYQLLCYNCNCAKGFFGYCPHNKIAPE